MPFPLPTAGSAPELQRHSDIWQPLVILKQYASGEFL